MCGIFGTFSNFTIDATQTKVFDDMLRAGVVRGEDGTGIMSVSGTYKKLEPDYIKIGGTPYELMRDKIYAPFMNRASKGKILVGHHRAATKGAITTDNAHPFMRDHICMVHNGTIRSGIDMKKHAVDSDGLCALVAEKGPAAAFSSISGAYACVWWDSKKQNLFFLKNDERPLHMITVRMNTYFASEWGMLSWLVSRHVQGLKDSDIKVEKLENDYLYSLDKDFKIQKGEHIAKKSWSGTDVGTKATISYLPPTTTSPNLGKDFRATFIIFDEKAYTDKWGQVYWQYVCYSEDFEMLFLNTKDRIPPEMHDDEWDGQLMPGPRTGMVPGYGTDVIFYQIKENSAVRIIKVEEPEDKNKLTAADKKALAATLPTKLPTIAPVQKLEKIETRVKTLDGYWLPKNKAEELAKENCAVCCSQILPEEVPKCVTMTSRAEVPIGLFCISCTNECIKTYHKKETVQ
jgi:hypothetical protein